MQDAGWLPCVWLGSYHARLDSLRFAAAATSITVLGNEPTVQYEASELAQ